ncbi:beta-defensin 126 [Macaca fascicularis]|uniref:Beta-defensin 126 n=1 Tax=Macaca fascicularis TaxID=9541 RepID=DB126_MACFA|nr:beta-defensin 126 [Macaca fascicularis]Q9BEE3.1 RecName: Full=Beta-defensin 126; AltName: Full=Defensin, beta 126; AltName: Full=Epididymal secretory protein 13.2; Short=ESP13.2; Flags: Precursor [Macaca fascicularis]CAC27133.1 ESP13.2 protein [Macaca fascicularis]
MKSLLFTLAVFMLLAQLVSGNLYVKRCLNDIGICKKTCKPEEVRSEHGWVMCGKRKACCVPADKRSAYPSFCVHSKTTKTSTVTARATATTATTATAATPLMISNGLISLMTTMAATPVSPTT